MLRNARLAAALRRVGLMTCRGPWSRAVGHRFLTGPPPGATGAPQPLWGGAAKIAGARFTPIGSFDSIYLAQDPITAFVEVSALILLPNGPAPLRSPPWVVINVDVIVNNVLDLTDAGVLEKLGTTTSEVTGPWIARSHSPTQRLGRLAHASRRIAGIRYASAKKTGGTNLVVFPDRLALAPGSFLEVFDPHRTLDQRLP
jgi:RES domain-containing protein